MNLRCYVKNKDKVFWHEKNTRINADLKLSLGMCVVDSEGNKGVVVKIIEPNVDSDGVVYIWQSDRMEYGSDNCEHYTYDGWKYFLRIV